MTETRTIERSPAGDERPHQVACRYHPKRRTWNHSGLCDGCLADKRAHEDELGADAALREREALDRW